MTIDTPPRPGRFSEAAALGLRVFPAKRASKEPALPWKKFQHEAPAADQIAAWDASAYNPCVVTGAASGVVVIDVDSSEGQELIDSLELPPTPAVRTSRGRHLYFRHPGYKFANRTNVEEFKIDVRGDGGYVIAAGSIHPSGAVYEWIVSPSEVQFAPMPENLVALLRKAEKTPRVARGPAPGTELGSTGMSGIDRFLANELSRAVEELSSAAKGERNNNLFKVAARLGRHVSASCVEWATFGSALAEAALAAGLDGPEIHPTIESGWNTGSGEPTEWIKVAREHAYLAYQERFYHVPSGTDLKPAGFNGRYGHLHTGKGTFANFLLHTECIRKVHDVTYEPLEPSLNICRGGLELLNTFKPSLVQALEGDPGPFLEFIEYLVPEEAERAHLIKMIAYTVRNPGRKLRHALLLRSAMQGVGKTMLVDIWGHLLGEHNVRKTTSKELAGDYQGYLPGKLLVVCEEMNLGMGMKTYNDLKDMITTDVAPINEKHLRQRECRIYATFVFLTNLDQPLLIEGHDRRIFYIDSPAERREPAYYKTFAEWWTANLGVIRGYLESVDLGDFNPHEAPPVTDSKLRLIAGSRSELAQELALAVAERHGCFDRDIVTVEQVVVSLGASARMRSKPQVMKALKEFGAFSLGQQRVPGSGRASLWAVRNVDYWRFADAQARADELGQSTGMFAALDGLPIDVVHVKIWPGDPALLFLPAAANTAGDADDKRDAG